MIKDARIPKMLGSNPKGNFLFNISRVIVTVPPVIIEKNAAAELGLFVNNAAKTGTIIPETIKE